MHWLRRLLFTFLACLAGVLVALVTETPGNYPFGFLEGRAPTLVFLAVEGLWTALDAAASYPIYTAVAFGVLALPMVVSVAASLIPRRIHKDPQRLYTTLQRAEASRLAGGRCEMEGILYARCGAEGTAGDHWYPHSLGGATTMLNQVWACTSCNSSKGARVPTFWETTRLEMRRRRYFPAGTVLRPGQKFGT